MNKISPRYLNGKVLLAMPTLADPRFHKAVIFLCAHDKNGAMGLVVNQRLPGVAFAELLEQFKIETEGAASGILNMPVFSGGPVEGSRGFLLHSAEFLQKDTIRIDTDFSVTGTIDALKAVVDGTGAPTQKMFILGYAGWTAGQLEREIQDNAWLVAEPHPDIIFHDNPDEKWELATRRMGINPAMLSSEVGRA